MKLIIQTVYEDIDQKWLVWWLKNSALTKQMPEVARCLKNGENCVFQSKDPTSEVVGTTSYTLTK